ncbi:hypothetical protein Taro_032722 [Colocasia esculenta]|uniref:DUF7054 domain-containing protein n=1 Tax=Colocasia esculenta TaxID=4460 RepID=A0A843WA86_COLES|nr:hypothetical protein [Colocasia esculenta]
MLVTVTVLGSAGPIRFVTSEGETVSAVVGTTLRCYAREGRVPALGFDVGQFHLFCAQSDYMDPLDLSESIGARGGRSFVLCKKTLQQPTLAAPTMGGTGTAADSTIAATRQTQRNEGDGGIGGGVRKFWFHKSSSHLKMASHHQQYYRCPLSASFFLYHP